MESTRKRHNSFVICLAVLFLCLSFFARTAEAACPGAVGDSSPVIYQDCTEYKDGNGGAGAIARPAGTQAGDFLVLVVAADGTGRTITPPPGFFVIDEGTNTANGSNDVQMGIYGFFSSTAGGGNLNFNVSGGAAYYSWLMRFSNTDGVTQVASGGGGGGGSTAASPSVTTTTPNNLILRVIASDGTIGAIDPGTIMTGHTGITQDTQTGVSGSAAYTIQASAGSSGTGTFARPSGEEWRAVTMALRPAGAGHECTGFNSLPSGGVIQYGGCMQNGVGGNNTSISVSTPPATQVGDFLVAVVATDGNRTISAPAGWSSVNQGQTNGGAATLAVFSRFAAAAGAQNHNFTWTGNEEAVAYIMRFTGTLGIDPDVSLSPLTGNGTNVSTPSVTTVHDNSLILRIGAFDDDDVTIPPAIIINGHNNIVQLESAASNNSVSSSAAWVNQATAGGSGTASFTSAPTASEETRRITLALRPVLPYFRIAHALTGSTCAATALTISADRGDGVIDTTYEGTIQLSTGSGAGYWAQGSANGTLVPGPGDGTATYTFSPLDNGVAVLSFFSTQTGVIDFDVVDGDGAAEGAGFDPALTLNACGEPAPYYLNHVCENNSDGSVDVLVLHGALDTKRLVILTIGSKGEVTLPTTATFDADGANVPMTLLARSYIDDGTEDSLTEYWGILSKDIPQAGGSFTVTHTGAGTLRAMCVWSGGLLEQEFAMTGVTTPNAGDGPVNINYESDNVLPGIPSPADNTITTLISVDTINSLFFSTVTNGSGGTYTTQGTEVFEAAMDGTATMAWVGMPIPFTVTNAPVTDTASVNTNRQTHALLVLPPTTTNPAVGFAIDTLGNGWTCAENVVTVSALDNAARVDPDYVGTITISASVGEGTWTLRGGQGTLTNLGNGQASYQFHADDDGVVALGYNTTSSGAIGFDVSDGFYSESPFFDEGLNVTDCRFRVSHDNGAGSLCVANAVTISVVDAGGNQIPGFVGAVNLSTTLVPGPGSGLGTWTQPAGFGLSDPVANDGLATFVFDGDEGGAVTLEYSRLTAGTVNINVSGGTRTEDALFDNDLVVSNCAFRISHDLSTDVCSAEEVTITAVGGGGQTLTNYAGTMTLSTSTGIGSWGAAIPAQAGRLTDLGSGNATFAFDATDAGVAVLNFSHPALSGGVDFNAVSGSMGVAPGFDDPLEVVGCTFRIEVASPNVSACGINTVTLSVYNSEDMLASDYAGVVSLSTSTAHGTWLSNTGAGALVDNNPNNGTGTLTMLAEDGGAVDLGFNSTTVEALNIIASADGIAVDPNFDESMQVTACVPRVDDVQCWATNDQANAITLPSSADTLGSRMVLMFTNSESATDVTAAEINGEPMTLLRREKVGGGGSSNTQEVWGILDADLPAGAGSVDAGFSGGDNGPAMCLVAVSGVEQQTLEYDGTSAVVVSGSTGTGQKVASTALTVASNNALLLSSISTGADGTSYNSSLPDGLWDSDDPNPSSVEFFGNSGPQATPAVVTIEETNSAASPNRHTHIVLALSPLVDTPPAVSGYVPVTLYKTRSGNVNYRAIGRSLRSSADSANPSAFFNFQSCSFISSATGNTAVLELPVGSTVTDAYLYWAGSGNPNQADVDVSFGIEGGTIHDITADGVFLIEEPFGNPVSYFAAYKDVSGLVSSAAQTNYRFRNLTVQTGGGWLDHRACVGGWALVVVYENPLENLNVINLFHGFQPFFHSSFTLVPRNFRMAQPDGVSIPNGLITHITFEGDNQDGVPKGCDVLADECSTTNLNDFSEVFELQDDPADPASFQELNNPVNTRDSENSRQYNNTISHPYFDANLQFDPNLDDPVAGVVDGYQSFTSSWGTDVDTYYIQGATDIPGPLGILHPFGSQEAEQITTRYATGQDLVMLVGEFISVTNAPIADLEVFVSDSGGFKVGTSGVAAYEYQVVNNGDGASGGYADGEVRLTGNLPAGITIASIDAPDGWACTTPMDSATAFTCVFDIAQDWTGGANAGQLAMGESLPTVSVSLNIGDHSAGFTLLNNDVTTVARLSHTGGNCPAELPGVQPDPRACETSPQFDNVNDLNKNLIDIDELFEKQENNNNVHSVTTNVRGVETNLRMVKTVAGVLEANEPAQYLLTVTNLGPDATTSPFTVNDTLPNGMTPVSATGANWNCVPAGQTVNCTHAVSLPAGASTVITLTTGNILPPLTEGDEAVNSATVTAGQYNFDLVATNNSSVNNTKVVGPVVEPSEQPFLISVSSLVGDTSIGTGPGALTFANEDLVLYDPLTDSALMFLEAGALPEEDSSLGDVDAVHLLPNGHLVLSVRGPDGSQLAGLGFGPEDLVLYDPLRHQATLIFDGSAIFTGAADVDAVHVFYNDSYDPADWDIAISTAGAAIIGALSFEDNDLVLIGLSNPVGTAQVLLDGASPSMFNGGAGDIDAAYVRHGNNDRYVLSTDDELVAIVPGGDGATYSRDDLSEFDASGPSAANVFEGDQPAGVFSPADVERRLDAVHVAELGYLGHFAVHVEDSDADTCGMPGLVTVEKHAGLGHVLESHYTGTVRLTLGSATATVEVYAGGGDLTPGANAGEWLYTFVAADGGQVVLEVNDDLPGTIDIDVHNGINAELATEPYQSVEIEPADNQLLYLDTFASNSFANSTGTADFEGPWVEENDVGDAASGKVRVENGRLRLNNVGGGAAPAVRRTLDLAYLEQNLIVEETPVLRFDWRVAGSPSVGSAVSVQARGSSADGWTTLATYGISPASGSAELPLNLPTEFSETTQVRFVVDAGYLAGDSDYFAVDNLRVEISTPACSGWKLPPTAIHHYHISYPGFGDGVNGTGISCLVSAVQVTAHSQSHLPIAAPGVQFTLQTVDAMGAPLNKGTWRTPAPAPGALWTPLGEGQLQYTFGTGQSSVVLPFNYTDVSAGNSETVGFNVLDANARTELLIDGHDPGIEIFRAGLRFYNESAQSPAWPNLIAGLNSNAAVGTGPHRLVVQAVRASDDDPLACVPVFDEGEVREIGFAAECVNPGNCFAGSQLVVGKGVDNGVGSVAEPIILAGDNGGSGIAVAEANFTPLALTFETQPSGDLGAEIVLNYGDAGAIQLHANFNIPLDDAAGGLQSGDFMYGEGSAAFVVRPFGFDVDFPNDRRAEADYTDAQSYAADHEGSAFEVAGRPFPASVAAVAYDMADDADADGVPDFRADLSDNAVTPNFVPGAGEKVRLSVITDHPGLPGLDDNPGVPGGVSGSIGGAVDFADFAGGVASAPQNITIDEVGIFDLAADLLDAGGDPVAYLASAGGAEGVSGGAGRVGRFRPDHFVLSAASLIPRAALSCTPASSFTYMGEEFGVNFLLSARNFNGQATHNYRGDFAFLDTYAELGVRALRIVSGDDDVAYGAPRFVNVGLPAEFSASWTTGSAMLEGNLLFNRQNPTTVDNPPDGPLQLSIVLAPEDEDGVMLDSFDVAFDDGVNMADYRLLRSHEFRYGRLRLENAYGSEIPASAGGADLDLRLVAEYFDGTGFAVNSRDDCTPYASGALSFVPGSYEAPLQDGDLDDGIQAVDGVLFDGGSFASAAGHGDDRPFLVTPAGEGADGAVVIELDLEALGLEFLRYDWRGALDIGDENGDGDYTDDPRSRLEFGTFRGNDRIINWQEIFE